MTTLTLTKMFVNLLATGASVAAQSNGRQSGFSNIGDVKQLAGERFRSVTVAGEAGVFSFVLLEVPVADVELLRAWKGQTVQVRDDRGRVFFGTYHQVTPTDIDDKKTSYNVAITLKTVTVDPGV